MWIANLTERDRFGLRRFCGAGWLMLICVMAGRACVEEDYGAGQAESFPHCHCDRPAPEVVSPSFPAARIAQETGGSECNSPSGRPLASAELVNDCCQLVPAEEFREVTWTDRRPKAASTLPAVSRAPDKLAGVGSGPGEASGYKWAQWGLAAG